MKIDATEAATSAVRRVKQGGRTNLVMVLGTGCCDSTAPFLYDDYLVEPDAVRVGAIDGVAIMAPGWLAALYPGDAALTVDADSGVVDDSFSLETAHGCRFTLRAPAAAAKQARR